MENVLCKDVMTGYCHPPTLSLLLTGRKDRHCDDARAEACVERDDEVQGRRENEERAVPAAQPTTMTTVTGGSEQRRGESCRSIEEAAVGDGLHGVAAIIEEGVEHFVRLHGRPVLQSREERTPTPRHVSLL